MSGILNFRIIAEAEDATDVSSDPQIPSVEVCGDKTGGLGVVWGDKTMGTGERTGVGETVGVFKLILTGVTDVVAISSFIYLKKYT